MQINDHMLIFHNAVTCVYSTVLHSYLLIEKKLTNKTNKTAE